MDGTAIAAAAGAARTLNWALADSSAIEFEVDASTTAAVVDDRGTVVLVAPGDVVLVKAGTLVGSAGAESSLGAIDSKEPSDDDGVGAKVSPASVVGTPEPSLPSANTLTLTTDVMATATTEARIQRRTSPPHAESVVPGGACTLVPPGATYREIGEALGMSHVAVQKILRG